MTAVRAIDRERHAMRAAGLTRPAIMRREGNAIDAQQEEIRTPEHRHEKRTSIRNLRRFGRGLPDRTASTMSSIEALESRRRAACIIPTAKRCSRRQVGSNLATTEAGWILDHDFAATR